MLIDDKTHVLPIQNYIPIESKKRTDNYWSYV